MRDVGEVHRTALAAADACGAPEEFRHQRRHRRPSQQRVDVPAVRAEHEIIRLERRRETGGDRFLAYPEVGGAFHQPLEEQIPGTLLEEAALLHHPVDREPGLEVRDPETSFLSASRVFSINVRPLSTRSRP